MRVHLNGIAMVICALAGLGLTLALVTGDIPIYFRLAGGDFPDPNRPGHLRCASVASLELLTKCILAVGLLSAALLFWSKLRNAEISLPPDAQSVG